MPDVAVRDASDTLVRLLGDRATFVDEVFGRRPLYRPATEATGVADLLTLDDVDHLVASSGLRAPAFRLVRQGETLPTSAVTRRARLGGRPVDDLVDVAAVHRAFADGATIVLQGLHRSWPAVGALCRDLDDALSHPVQANAYLTPPVAQGLDLHADPHDVIVVHTHGTKRWVVEPAGEPAWDLTLRPGAVLYLPAGTRHAAQTTDVASLHVTIGVRTTTWRELLDRAVRDVLSELEGVDEPLPAGWATDPDALAAELRARLARVSSGLDDPDVAARSPRAAAEARTRSRIPDRRGGLLDILEAQDLRDDGPPLRVRPGATTAFEERDGEVVLTLHDRRLRMPGFVGPAVRALLDAGRGTPSDLAEHLDHDSRLVLCRRLVREGVLAIERGDGG